MTGGGIVRRSSAACPEAARGLSWAPRFTHELLDRTTLEPGAVGGGVGTPLLFVAQRLESNAGLTASQP